jgi:D-alanine-D-alanine ligase-like ATP-grasp enzyme
MNPSKRKNSFEFFGFDFMIDEDFRVWLIEVNTNPQIAILNKQMTNLVPKMF